MKNSDKNAAGYERLAAKSRDAARNAGNAKDRRAHERVADELDRMAGEAKRQK